MPHSRRHEIERRFAEGLVAQMLQRSGSEFFHLAPSRLRDRVDFLVNKGDEVCGIEVLYAEHTDGIEKLWNKWKGVVRAPVSKHGPALTLATTASKSRSTEHEAHPDVHLVVVTGRGDRIFAEQAIAPLLAPDVRTHISVLGG